MATKYKSMYKYELADAAGVSPRTFTRWLNMHAVQLRKLGVTQNAHLLPPSAVKYLCETFVIEL